MSQHSQFDPLWINTHRPGIEDLPQDVARETLQEMTSTRINLLLYGPQGVGKSAAVRAYAQAVHKSPKNNTQYIDAGDFFDMTKREIADHQKWGRWVDAQQKRDMSKADLMMHVLRELAASGSIESDYQTIVIENADQMREDFQEGLRRVIEGFSDGTQFIMTARSTGALIDAIESRFFPIPVRQPTEDEIRTILDTICAAESTDWTDDGVDHIAATANGDLRYAIGLAQTAAQKHGTVDVESAEQVVKGAEETVDRQPIISAVVDSEMDTARKAIDELLIDDQLSGEIVLEQLTTALYEEYGDDLMTDIAPVAATVSQKLQTGKSDRIHLMSFLSEVNLIIPPEEESDSVPA